MKFIFSLIRVGICIGLALLALMLLINTTFLREVYKTNDMSGDGIPILKFMYQLTSNNKSRNASFVTISEIEDLNDKKEEYMKKLQNCYGIYYYDAENDITLTKYDVSDNGSYRTVNINYDIKNYCGEDYILSDTWINDYNNYAKIEESTISEIGAKTIINYLYNAKRNLSPIINPDYKSEVTINMYINHRDGKYNIDIKDFGENEVIVIKTKANERQFAVYEVPNAINFLKNIK